MSISAMDGTEYCIVFLSFLIDIDIKKELSSIEMLLQSLLLSSDKLRSAFFERHLSRRATFAVWWKAGSSKDNFEIQNAIG